MMFAPPGTPLSAPPSFYSPQTSPVSSPVAADGNNGCSQPNLETPSPTSSGTPTPLADCWFPGNAAANNSSEMLTQENHNITYIPQTPFMVRTSSPILTAT